MWWHEPIDKRVVYIDQKFNQHILNVSKKILFLYPPVPLQKEDLYNLILFKLAKEMETYEEKMEIEFFILARSKVIAKIECRRYLVEKHRILTNSVPLEEKYLRISDSTSLKAPLNLDVLSYSEKEIFDLLYIKGETKTNIMKNTPLSRRELDKIVKSIKNKIKNQV